MRAVRHYFVRQIMYADKVHRMNALKLFGDRLVLHLYKGLVLRQNEITFVEEFHLKELQLIHFFVQISAHRVFLVVEGP